MKTILATVLFCALIGCSAPTPIQDLDAASSLLSIASALPALTPNEKAWTSAEAGALLCAANVLGQGLPVAQESGQVLTCFALIPLIPVSQQPYFNAAVAAVNLFVSLFDATGTNPAAVASNAAVKAMPAASKTAALTKLRGRLQAIPR